MAYRKFLNLNDIEKKFNVTQKAKRIFEQPIQEAQPSDWLVETLERNRGTIRMSTEKAVSEAIIMPILSEVQLRNKDKLTLFSGEILVGDKAMGLNGEIDFFFINRPDSYSVYAPVINVTEAKLNQAIEKSLAQAAAQMLGARKFNEKNDSPIQTIHGAVANAAEWQFLKLEEDTIWIDTDRYQTEKLSELLGVFQVIVDFYNK